MNVPTYATAVSQLRALNAGKTTSVELLDLHLKRFRDLNPRLNAVIKTDIARARERASGLDKMRQEGRTIGPLHGLPMTVKDTFDVEGMPAVAGAPQYLKRAPQVNDADAVSALKTAGAVIWGKTNAPYLAGDWQSYNSVYGSTSNPWELTHSPGGSSGGSAAALATGITPLEVGSDIGGSLRIPAHFCGVASLKPTFGVISQKGHVPPDPSFMGAVDLNVVGPMARSVKDLRLLYAVLARAPGGYNPKESRTSLEDLKIATWVEEDGFPLSVDCVGAVEEAAAAAREAGASVSGAKPDVEGSDLIETYLKLLIPIVAMDTPPLARGVLRSLRGVFKFQRLIGAGPFSRANWALQSTISHDEWLGADEKRARMKAALREFFEQWDAIIAPVTPTAAFPKNERGDVISRKLTVDDVNVPYASNLCWIALATACHLPSAVIPITRNQQGLPLGVQIVGPQGSDTKVLEIAEALEHVLGGFRKPPIV